MRKINTKKLVLAALFLAIGIVLPFLTGQIKEIGDSLLPMHIPVMLCGLICGPAYGCVVGLLLPFVRSALFSMTPIYPAAVWMGAEMAVYGLIIGIFYTFKYRNRLVGIYISLIAAMLSGRIAWGIVKALLLTIGSNPFTFAAFIAGGFVDALPGIILQLILIPSVMVVLEKVKRG